MGEKDIGCRALCDIALGRFVKAVCSQAYLFSICFFLLSLTDRMEMCAIVKRHCSMWDRWSSKLNQKMRLSSNHIPSFLGPALRNYYLADHINNRPLLRSLSPSLPPSLQLCVSAKNKAAEHLVLINIELHFIYGNAAGQKSEAGNWRCLC